MNQDNNHGFSAPSAGHFDVAGNSSSTRERSPGSTSFDNNLFALPPSSSATTTSTSLDLYPSLSPPSSSVPATTWQLYDLDSKTMDEEIAIRTRPRRSTLRRSSSSSHRQYPRSLSASTMSSSVSAPGKEDSTRCSKEDDRQDTDAETEPEGHDLEEHTETLNDLGSHVEEEDEEEEQGGGEEKEGDRILEKKQMKRAAQQLADNDDENAATATCPTGDAGSDEESSHSADRRRSSSSWGGGAAANGGGGGGGAAATGGGGAAAAGGRLFFWKQGFPGTRSGSRSRPMEETNDGPNPPTPQTLDMAISTGQAYRARNGHNRRWIRFTRPGAVQMSGRAPYSGELPPWVVREREQLVRLQEEYDRRQLERQSEQQQQQLHLRQQQQQQELQRPQPHPPLSPSAQSASDPDTLPIANVEVGLPAFVAEEGGFSSNDPTQSTARVCVEGLDVSDMEKEDGRRRQRAWCILTAVFLVAVSVVVAVVVEWAAGGTPAGAYIRTGGLHLVSSQPTPEPSLHPTAGPTVSPTSEYEVGVALALAPVSSHADLNRVGSPQYRARAFLTSIPDTVSGAVIRRPPQDARFLQRYILAVFFFATRLDEQRCQTLPHNCAAHFLSHSHDECDWVGIDCNSEGMVTKVNLGNWPAKLGGTLPSELGGLTELVVFKVIYKDLQGTIPNDLPLGAKKLEVLVLNGNNLMRPFPVGFRNHGSLRILGMARNHNFGGPIPPIISTIPHLHQFSFDACGMTGPIPTELAKMRKLEQLLVGDNLLTGTIPKELARLPLLQGLNVSFNLLTGPLTETIMGAWPLMNQIVLGHNRLSGHIPDTIPLKWGVPRDPQVKITVDLSHNEFVGSIPSTLAQLEPIRFLTLHGNNFTGLMPTEICDLTDTHGNGNDFFALTNLTADCAEGENGTKVKCHCCQACY